MALLSNPPTLVHMWHPLSRRDCIPFVGRYWTISIQPRPFIVGLPDVQSLQKF
jgi:hypothetical protein